MKAKQALSSERRDFIKRSGAAALAAATPTLVLGEAATQVRSEPVTDQVRWGMHIDANKCVDGCTACVDACDEENGLDMLVKPEGAAEDDWARQKPRWIRKVKLKDNLTDQITTLPLMCVHCEHPPCVDVCPTGASFLRADGVAMVDRHTCIGCRYCMMACPYKARSFVHENVQSKPTRAPRGKGCVESCNFCAHRLDRGGTTTACQDACEKEGHRAIVFGDLRDPNSPVAQKLKAVPSVAIRDDLKLNPGVRFSGI